MTLAFSAQRTLNRTVARAIHRKISNKFGIEGITERTEPGLVSIITVFAPNRDTIEYLLDRRYKTLAIRTLLTATRCEPFNEVLPDPIRIRLCFSSTWFKKPMKQTAIESDDQNITSTTDEDIAPIVYQVDEKSEQVTLLGSIITKIKKWMTELVSKD